MNISTFYNYKVIKNGYCIIRGCTEAYNTKDLKKHLQSMHPGKAYTFLVSQPFNANSKGLNPFKQL